MGDPPLRVPPQAIEAEQYVLGALLTDNRVWQQVASRVDSASFYRMEHREIFGAVSRLIGAGVPADVITVADALRARAVEIDPPGWMAYLHGLAVGVMLAGNAHAYADIVADRALRRRAIALADDLASAAWSDRGDALAAIDRTVAALLALAQGRDRREPRPLADLLPAWLETLAAMEQGEIDAIPTGYPDWDEIFAGGWRRGDFVVIASRPSMGKTALAHSITRQLARTAPVLVLSMEDSLSTLMARQVASTGRLNLADMRNPARAKSPIWERVTIGVERLHGLPIDVDDQPALGVADIRRKAQMVASRRGDIGVVVIDYLQLMDGDGASDNRAYELAKVVRALKAMAKDMNCVVVLLSQLNRKADETRGPPALYHLAESGGIEQAADMIGLLWRRGQVTREPSDKHHAQVEWAKNKNGPTRTIEMWFDGATQRMEAAHVEQ